MRDVQPEDDPSDLSEVAKFDNAVQASAGELQAVIDNKGSGLQAEETEILETQIEFLRDPQIRTGVLKKIAEEHLPVYEALTLVIHELKAVFDNMDDEYMRARSADIQDIGNRLLRHLSGSSELTVIPPGRDIIIIAEDISPSETIAMNPEHIAGFATRTGAAASHTAILARAKGIPAVVACGEELNLIRNDDMIILDGRKGIVLVNPDSRCLEDYIRLKAENARRAEQLRSLKDMAAVTADGTEIELLGNISDVDELRNVMAHGGRGVGLLRTEMLFMGRHSYPDEEEQFEFYRSIAESAGDLPVIVRTLDIGGDKQLDYFDIPAEQNPFLGYRAIRICLDRPDLFITQLKAILRASVYGNLKIMFPMISCVGELKEAKLIMEATKAQLRKNAVAFRENIETGIMIEVPSAALTADILAREADFFSIGTNDLCQYTLAADRMNEKVGHLYNPYDPAVLRLIKYVIEQANKNNIGVGICGEMASEPLAVKLLLGMGLRHFSVSASSLPDVKQLILNANIDEARSLCEKVMEQDSAENVIRFLQERSGEQN